MNPLTDRREFLRQTSAASLACLGALVPSAVARAAEATDGQRLRAGTAQIDITPQELKETISFFNGMLPRQFETLNQVLGQLVNPELYGLGKDYLPTYLDRISKVTAADVRNAAQKYIDPKNLLIVVVSKADDVREMLKQFGPVTEIELSDL